MPHATTTTTTINGEKEITPHTTAASAQSSFLTHLSTYPFITHTLSTLKRNPYSASALSYADAIYAHVTPYLNKKPYTYAAPYVSKADSLADAGLARVDATFPMVKEEPEVLLEYGKKVIWMPLRVLDEGATYVKKTYDDEYTKTLSPHRSNTANASPQHSKNPRRQRHPGLQTTFLAILSTELKIAVDFLQAAKEILQPRYEASRNAISARAGEVQGEAKRYTEVYVRAGKETADVWRRAGEETVGKSVNGGGSGAVVVNEEGKN